jgi:hypothetical protein
LYEAWDAGFDGTDTAGDLVFLTARPSAGGHFRRYTYDLLANKCKVRTPFSILNGEFGSLFTDKAMANKKFLNFAEYKRLYPEYRFCFMGDSGQGDILLGERMLSDDEAEAKASKRPASADKQVLIMIHNIVEKAGNAKSNAARYDPLLLPSLLLLLSILSPVTVCSLCVPLPVVTCVTVGESCWRRESFCSIRM